VNPEDLKFAKTHEWVHVDETSDGKVATVGLSAFAVDELTDLVYIELPQVGAQVTAGESMCEIESVKAVSDIYAPVSGEVVEVNGPLADQLETLSDDPYNEGWIVKIRVADDAPLAQLMDYKAYQAQCAEDDH